MSKIDSQMHRLHTSKRMHFIEEPRTRSALSAPGLAYVKTYALH